MDMIKRFVRYYKPHKRLFMLDTACSLMVAVCDLFYPMIAKNITNVYVPNKDTGRYAARHVPPSSEAALLLL